MAQFEEMSIHALIEILSTLTHTNTHTHTKIVSCVNSLFRDETYST